MPFTLDGRIKGKQNGKISIEMTVANISLYIKKNDMAPLFSLVVPIFEEALVG